MPEALSWRALPAVVLLGCGEPASFAPPDLSGEVSDAAVLWNGSHTAWTYNHRINRLGSYVGSTDCDSDGLCTAVVRHGAASGSGDDVATLRGFHTVVQSDGLSFLQGYAAFELGGKRTENEVVALTEHVRVALDEPRLDRDQHVAVLGGFDLASTSDPDRLAMLELGITPVERRDDGLAFDVSVQVALDCDSPECAPFDKSIDYDLYVVWTLIAADGGVDVAGQLVEHDYEWQADDREDELSLEDHQVDVRLEGSGGGWAAAAPVLRSLAVQLDDDHHMVTWAAASRLDAFDQETGAAELTADLFFQQWNQETWDRLSSYTSPGSARWLVDLAVLRLAQGCAEPGETAASIEWDADGGAAADAASIVEVAVSGSCR